MKAPSPPYKGPANRHGGKGNKPINRIVIHCTVSACATSANAIAAYFRRTTKAASAHYVVDAKYTLQTLYDSYIGYHAPPNSRSLGVELCCTLHNEGKGHWQRSDHQKMLKRAATLVAGLCLAYDVPITHLTGSELRSGKRGITGHANVRDAWGQTSHWDPGPHFPWDDFLRMVRQEADRLSGKKPEPKPKPKGKPKSKKPSPPNRVERANVHVDKAEDLLTASVKAGRTGHVKDYLDRLRRAIEGRPRN